MWNRFRSAHCQVQICFGATAANAPSVFSFTKFCRLLWLDACPCLHWAILSGKQNIGILAFPRTVSCCSKWANRSTTIAVKGTNYIYKHIQTTYIYVAVWMAPKSLGKPQLKNMSCLPNSVSFFKQFRFYCSCLIHGWCCEYYFKRWKHVIVHVVTSPWPSQKRSHLQLQSALLKDVWIEMTGGLGLGRIIWTPIFNFGVRCSSDHRGRYFPSQ